MGCFSIEHFKQELVEYLDSCNDRIEPRFRPQCRRHESPSDRQRSAGTLASDLCCTLGEQKNTPAKRLPLQIDSPSFANGKSLCF